MRLSTIRGRVLALLLLASAPAILVGLVSAALDLHEAEEEVFTSLHQERDVASASYRAALDAADGLLAAMGAIACASPGPLRVTILDETGATRCGPAGTADPVPGWFGAVRDTGEAVAAAVPQGAVVAHPLRRDGRFDGAVAATLRFATEIRGSHHWLMDRAGRAVPLTAAAPALPPDLPGAADFTLATPEGTRLAVTSAQVAPGLTLLVGRPIGSRMGSLLHAGSHLVELLLLLGVAGAVAAIGLHRVVNRPLERFSAGLQRWRAGREPFPAEELRDMPEELRGPALSLREGAASLSTREAELRAALEHGEVLAAEIHHRVKNNFQVVASLLALQAGRITEPKARAEFEAARDRIGALATLHRHMYVHHDPEAIDLEAFLRELGAQLFAAVGERPGRRIAFDVEAPALRLSSDQAVPLTLIITEAITNALKHGFPGLQRGRISIRLEAKDGHARLTVVHDGEALTSDAKPGLGSTLLSGLARQVGGHLQRQDDAAGSRLTLDFGLTPPLARPMMPAARTASR